MEETLDLHINPSTLGRYNLNNEHIEKLNRSIIELREFNKNDTKLINRILAFCLEYFEVYY